MIRFLTTLMGVVALRTAAFPAVPEAPNNEIATVLQPNRSPLVSFRILFHTGAAYDPPGKEGVAALCAAMLAKPMAVTLPCVLALLDLWPLQRTGTSRRRLMLEKLPLFIPVIAISTAVDTW